MQYMSEALKTAMAAPMRAKGIVKIDCDIVDVSAARQAQLNAPDIIYYGDVQHANGETVLPEAVTATIEPMRFRTNGTQLAAPDKTDEVKINEGYISDTVSGADGTFAVPPCISVLFSSLHTVNALTLVFDSICSIYPSLINITALNGEQEIYNKDSAPTSAEWIINEQIQGFDKLVITFKKSKLPHSRARLQQLLFGITAHFTSNNLGEVSCKQTLDPLMRRLPESTLAFEVVNCDISAANGDIYDPDNPKGVWKYLEQPCPVRAYYGMPCGDDKHFEWVQLGRFYLTGQPKVTDLFVTLNAASVLDLLTDECSVHTDIITERNLYDEAQLLLDTAGIDFFYSGVSRSISNVLKTVKTTAPLPKKPVRECLQYIAHAAGCVLYTNRSGTLCIQPISEENTDLNIAFDTLLQKPSVSKNAALSRAVCKVYTYESPDTSSTHTVTAEVQNAEPGCSEEAVDNVLITDDNTALETANRVREYLLKRTVYECEYRGLPALEAGDKILLQGRVTGSIPVRIAEHTLTFGSGITGKFKAKRTE